MPDLPFKRLLDRSASLRAAIDAVPEAGTTREVTGLAGALRGLYAGMLHASLQRQIIVISPDSESGQDIWSDAALLLGEEHVLFIGERYARARQVLREIENETAEHVDTLRVLTEHPRRVLVTDIERAFLDFPSARDIADNAITLERFASMRQEDLVRRLAYGGFERTEHVSASGEYAVRGGIVDVFPIGFDSPLRIEFFGDEIDSMREFDPLNQRSIRRLDSVAFVTSLFLEESGVSTSPMFEFFAPDAVLIIMDAELVRQGAERLGRADDLATALARHAVIEVPAIAGRDAVNAGADPQPAFNAAVKLLTEHLAELDARGYASMLVADSEQQARRLEDLLASPGADEEDAAADTRRRVIYCPLSLGFTLHDVRLAVLTEHQIFNRRRVRKEQRRVVKGLSLREMKQLKPGDYVVHVDKGIGRFAGFHTITVNGGLQETAKLLYADDDVLYVNLNYINRLQKYSSEEGAAPRLSKLGTAEWDRIRAKTKKRLKDIARELISLYAKRRAAQGHAFSPDAQWQKEMEASFIYEDTPDQYQATVDVKRDMEQPVPMDRLVCGDVGYGKTEVAIRAAFKAVLDGKQVAVLVPTTILAQQHFNTFHDRLHRYSVVVESLSRFKSKAEQKDVVERLKHGKVDILIGTHRLLSADIGFRDLGLLVVDEEHRFGVSAKEKLRQMRASVDTLTLTATPIPRTLNFSLLGARDLSIIETPPKNRLPVITSIVHWDARTIADGINREIARGGQVYFVNDRINDLELLADRIRVAVPGVRVLTAHGQMTAAELERAMLRFLEKKVDVLVTTKIIESGLDIPNANTIFVNRAERFGLAELYQLRGRVGRSNIQAYAFFLVPPEAKLSRDALKRLQAIEEFSELGAGFQLAMRDLEIRGAGNMLGAEQSGFIAEIGFELYLNTIEEAVTELKNDEFADVFAQGESVTPQRIPRLESVMELGFNAYLPQSYVASSTERFDLYRRLYNATDERELTDIEEEIFDRFGLYPPETENLLFAVRTRLLAARIPLARVTLEAPVLTLVFPSGEDDEFYQRRFPVIVEWIMRQRDRMRLEQDRSQVRLRIDGVADARAVEAVLKDLCAVCDAQAEAGRDAVATDDGQERR